ncbi:MAG: SDR family NAD(P)-dependent oxidoreductase [Aliiglaciecola sp.]
MLEDKHILITGASSGIGRATAIECANQGAFVYLAGRDKSALNALKQTIPNSSILEYDVTVESEVKAAFACIAKSDHTLDGVVNCAGKMLDAGIAMTRVDDFNQQLQVNTVSTFLHCQLAARLMTRQRRGSIVNLCSAVGEQGSAGQSAYAASKAAVSGLTLSLSKELGNLGILVNAVSPGFIDTPMTAEYQGEKKQNVLQHSALKRAGSAEEVASVITFLLSSKASYITGQIIGVDGGLRV